MPTVGPDGRERLAQTAVRTQRLPAVRRQVTPSDWLEPVEAHHRTGHQHEREPPSRVPVPAHLQPPEATQPRQRPFNLPAVAPKPGRRLDLAASDPRGDLTPAEVGP